MFADDFFQNIPNHRLLHFHHAFGRFDRVGQALRFEFVVNERFEQFQSHQFWQTALVQFELWTNHNHRTTGVVHTFTQQVLTETTAFTFDHVGQRFQRAFVRARHGFTTTAVIEQRVYRFLQHTFFVARDDLWRTQFEQAFQTVVTVDHATVQIVQVGGRETTAVQRYQRTQIRWQYRQNFQNHPFRLDARAGESFQHFQTFSQFFDFGFGRGVFQLFTQFFNFRRHVEFLQQLADAFRAHQRAEFVTVFFNFRVVIVLGHDLAAFERGHTRINHHECFEIQHAFDVAQSHVQHHTQAGWQGFEEPDVRHGRGQVNVTHALTTHFGQSDFDAATLTGDATMFQTFVFTAQAFVVLHRAENFRAEQAVTFRFERAVVDGFRLFHFTVRPRTNFIRRGQTDLNHVEIFVRLNLLKQIEHWIIHSSSS